MVTKRIVKKTAQAKAHTTKTSRKVARSTSLGTNAGPVKQAVLAGLGAAERMQKRVQDQATKAYGGLVDVISRESGRFSGFGNDTAKVFAKQANMLVREGKKVQSDTQALAQAKALEVAKEIRSLAAKTETAYKKNIKGAVKSTLATAKEGVTKLEHVFEARVARTLNTFGIPSSQNVRELQARMADLQKALVQLNKRNIRA